MFCSFRSFWLKKTKITYGEVSNDVFRHLGIGDEEHVMKMGEREEALKSVQHGRYFKLFYVSTFFLFPKNARGWDFSIEI